MAAGKAGAPLSFRDVGPDRLPMLPWMTLDPAPAHTGAINGLIKSIRDPRRGKRRGEMEDVRQDRTGMSLIKTHSTGETCMRFSYTGKTSLSGKNSCLNRFPHFLGIRYIISNYVSLVK